MLPNILVNNTIADADEVMENFNYLESLVQNQPRGHLLNGRFTVTDTGTGILISLLTLAGNTPSSADPVSIRIGNTSHTIDYAVTRTIADGTNHCNAGGAELATKELDWFLYAVWDSNSNVVQISPSRIPYGNLVSDFNATATNERHLIGYADYTTTDEIEVIGRFAATLSAGAAYTWSLPAYTAVNLIQKPVYETRWLVWTPILTGISGGTAPTFTATFQNRYKISGNILDYSLSWNNSAGGTAGSGANALNVTLPLSSASTFFVTDRVGIGTGNVGGSINNIVTMYQGNGQGSSSFQMFTGAATVTCANMAAAGRFLWGFGKYEI